jgi:hypothetical protein
MTDEEDLDATATIMESLKWHWAVTDQQIFIAAVIVNPFYQGRPFAQLHFLNNNGIHSLLAHLFTRFYQVQAPQDFHAELTEYLTHMGHYVLWQSKERGTGKGRYILFPSGYCEVNHWWQCIHPDLLSIFVDFSFAGQPPTPFIQLAQRILTICDNSATCERPWSVFGITLTKLRNHLGLNTLTSLSELKMHIQDEHMLKETKVQMKQMFIKRTETAHASSSAQPIVVPEGPLITESVINPQLLDASINNTPQVAQLQSNDRFGDMAAQHVLSAKEDETDHEPVAVANIIGHSVKLVELFNFTDSHWVQVYEQAAHRSFEEELELYELLDLDDKGEEETNVDVDDSTGELLIG